jgi:7-cyano-7-deazaguanine tRNA-ribosyltransferase
MVTTPFGPVPLELDSIYPIGQSVLPDIADLPPDELRRLKAVMASAAHRMDFKATIIWEGEKTLQDLAMVAPKGKSRYDLDMMKVIAVCDYQFGPGAAGALLGTTDVDELKRHAELVKSKNTGMIRNVLVDGEHVLSMRAEDGFFSIKIAGARRLVKAFRPPRLRVVVDADSFEFNKQGKNVFAPFVKDADPELRPGDEAVIVNEKDEVAGVGKALLNRAEMLAFKAGIAVKTREGVSSPSPDAV